MAILTAGALVLAGVSISVAAQPGERAAADNSASVLNTFPGAVNAEDVPIALLVDASTGQTLFARNANRRFVPASITKVMTAYVAFELLKEGKIALSQSFTVSDTIAEEWSGKGSTMFLAKGDRVTVETLLRAITSVSANDGSIMLAVNGLGSTEKWVARMNAEARALGMRDSHFGTPNGWPDEGRTFTTARDLQKLASAIVNKHPAYYRHFFGREGFSYNGIAQANHDPLVGRVEGAEGIKTGFTNEAGAGFLGSASRDGRRLLVVVAGADEVSVRDEASRALLEWGFGRFEIHKLFPKGDEVAVAHVQGGSSDKVSLIAERPLSIALPDGTEPEDVDLFVRYRGPIPAPIEKDAEIAELEVRVQGKRRHLMPLVAATDVPTASPWRRLTDGLNGMWR